jgi:hypothetical protein
MKLCECGCGNLVTKKGNKYILGHNHKGKTYEKIYGNLADEQKEKRRIAIEGTLREDMIGDKNFAKRLEVREKIKTGVKESWRINPKQRMTEEVIKKIRKIKEENGTCVKEEDLNDFELYGRRVKKHTSISIKEKYSKKDLETIGRTKDHIDHIFSIQKGFISRILPQIIGSKSNIRILNGSENCKKHTKCDISINKLFEKYDIEVYK